MSEGYLLPLLGRLAQLYSPRETGWASEFTLLGFYRLLFLDPQETLFSLQPHGVTL